MMIKVKYIIRPYYAEIKTTVQLVFQIINSLIFDSKCFRKKKTGSIILVSLRVRNQSIKVDEEMGGPYTCMNFQHYDCTHE